MILLELTGAKAEVREQRAVVLALQVNIMYHKAEPAECRAAERAAQRLMETVVALGGAISGEHGIRLAKTPFRRFQHPPAQVRAMQADKMK